MHLVKLKAITQPVDDDIPGVNELLAHLARVSSAANEMNHDTGPKLIASLIKRKEWSPLEMVYLTMEIHTTRDIGRQILRHVSFRFQEFSQRYAVVKDEPIYRETRRQHATDRQSSVEMQQTDEDALLDLQWHNGQRAVHDLAMQVYNRAINAGVAKECARAVLPEGMTPTRMYMAGTLRSWIHYVMLRDDRKTQKEHMLIAADCRRILNERFPVLAEVLNVE